MCIRDRLLVYHWNGSVLTLRIALRYSLLHLLSHPRLRCSTRFWSGSSWIYRLHWTHHQHFFQAQYSAPISCWWHNFTTTVTSLMSQLCYPTCRLVSTTWIYFVRLFVCSSTQEKLNSSGLVLDQPGHNISWILECGIFIHSLCPHCAQSWCYIWLRIIHEITHHKTASTCFFPSEKAATTARCSDWWNYETVTSLVLSRLDYCNSVLNGLSASSLAPCLFVYLFKETFNKTATMFSRTGAHKA